MMQRFRAVSQLRRARSLQWTQCAALSTKPRPFSSLPAEAFNEEDFPEQPDFTGMKGGQLVHQALLECGVEHIFGYSGGANLPVLDTFYDSPIQFVMNRSEQCCGHAAQGYAKASGKVGVILTTSGPGLTNIITPLQDSKGDSVPIVALSGQVPTSAVGTDAFQECLAVDLTRPCTKWSYQVQSIEEVRSVIHEAFMVANSGKRGPVHIDLPKDIMVSLLNGPDIEPCDYPKPMPPPMHVIEKVAALINMAKKPIIYAGQGTLECGPELTALAELANIPVTTTLHAMGTFDELNPKSLHMLGMHGAAYANFAVQRADLILAIGSRFDDRTTGVVAKYAPEAHKAHEEGRGGLVHFDIERTQFGRVVNPTVAVEGDCADGLRMLQPLVEDGNDRSDRHAWLEQCQAWKKEHPFQFARTGDGKIKTQQVIDAIYQGLAHKIEDVVVSTGVGNHQMMACQFIRWRAPRSIISSGSLGTMGFGLPAAIGAQVGCPDKTVVLVDGDGSFNMTLNDLGTVAELGLPVKIAIVNDARQQMVHVWQKLFFEGRLVATNNHNPDFAALAASYGIESFHCGSEEELPGAIDRFVNAKGPVLCEFKVVPDVCLPMVAPGKALDEMFLFGDPQIAKLLQGEGQLEGEAPN